MCTEYPAQISPQAPGCLPVILPDCPEGNESSTCQRELVIFWSGVDIIHPAMPGILSLLPAPHAQGLLAVQPQHLPSVPTSLPHLCGYPTQPTRHFSPRLMQQPPNWFPQIHFSTLLKVFPGLVDEDWDP